MAEREGFEPSERDKPFEPLAGAWFKPLTHLSVYAYNGYASQPLPIGNRWTTSSTLISRELPTIYFLRLNTKYFTTAV